MQHHGHLKKDRNYVLIVILTLMSAWFLYPFYHVVIVSFNDAFDSYSGHLYLFPRQFTLVNYMVVFANKYLINAFIITISRVLIMAVSVTFLCSLYGYALTYPKLIMRKFFTVFMIVPMYISGGVIPFYMVLRSLHLVDTFLVYIVPFLYTPFYIMLFRSYFQDNVQSLREAAIVDGASEIGSFLKIIMPISVPVLAVVALYTAVSNWNEWYVGQAFVSRAELWPLQTIMLQVIKSQEMKYSGLSESIVQNQSRVTSDSVRMAMIVICIVPILAVYPFLQKYFIHGIMLGSVKE